MNNKELTIKQNIIWNSIGDFVYLVMQWLITILVARGLGFANAGIYSLAMSITAVFYCISTWGLGNYQISDVEEKYRHCDYIAVRLFTCGIAFLCCVLFVSVNDYTIYQKSVIIAYMLYKISEASVDVLSCIDQKKFRMDFIGQSFLLRGILGFAVFSAALYTMKNLLIAIILMTLTSFTIIILFDLRKTRTIAVVSARSSFQQMKALLVEGIPLAANSMLTSAIVTIPRYFLEKIQGETLLGIYGSIAAPTLIVQVAASYLISPLTVPLAERWYNKDKKNFLKMVMQIILALCGISIGALAGAKLLGKWLLILLLGKEISAYAYVLIPIVFCTVLTAFIWFTNTLLVIFREAKGLLIGNIIGVLVCIAVSEYMIEKFYVNGTSYALFSGYFVQLLVSVGFIVYRIQKNLK